VNNNIQLLAGHPLLEAEEAMGSHGTHFWGLMKLLGSHGTHFRELMKSWDSHGSLLLLFMMKKLNVT
jgi:hypothetical protein